MKRKLISLLPVIFTGTFIFAQPATGYDAVVKIICNTSPVSATVEKAALKYNKDFAYSFTFDDGKSDSYTNVYPLFSGGYIQEKNLTLPGLSFSDGCGNKIHFTGGMAINSVNSTGFDPHEGNPGSISWLQVQELYNKGWNVFNHSFTHSQGPGTDYAYEISENTNYIKNKTGITTTHFVVPSGDSNYVPAAFNQNMKAVYNQQHNFPGTEGITVDGAINLNEFKLFRRYINDDNYNSTNIREKIDLIASQSSATNHLWFTDFTHSVSFEPTGGSILFSTFQDYMNYIETSYGIKGSDRIWMAPLQDVYEYLQVREGIQYNTSISGDTLLLYLDFQSVPQDLDHYALTFKINSPDFTNVLAENLESFSFNGSGTTKLLNVVWKKNTVTTSMFNGKNFNPCDMHEYTLVENPGKPLIRINPENNINEKLQVALFDNLGRLLNRKTYFLGGNEISIPVSDLRANIKPGVYFIKLLGEKTGCRYERKVVLY